MTILPSIFGFSARRRLVVGASAIQEGARREAEYLARWRVAADGVQKALAPASQQFFSQCIRGEAPFPLRHQAIALVLLEELHGAERTRWVVEALLGETAAPEVSPGTAAYEVGRAMRAAAELAAQVLEALADGVIDVDEARSLVPVARRAAREASLAALALEQVALDRTEVRA